MEVKPSHGTDPGGCGTRHCGGRSAGIGDGCLQGRVGGDGAGRKPSSGSERKSNLHRRSAPPGRPPTPRAGTDGAALRNLRARRQVGKRRDRDRAAGAGQPGAAAGTRPARPAGRAASEEVGDPGGDPASGSVRQVAARHRAPSGGTGRSPAGRRRGQPRGLVLGSRMRPAAPRPRHPPRRTLAGWDAVPPPPRHRAPQTERAPPGGAARASTCGSPRRPAWEAHLPAFGGCTRRDPGWWRGAGTVPELRGRAAGASSRPKPGRLLRRGRRGRASLRPRTSGCPPGACGEAAPGAQGPRARVLGQPPRGGADRLGRGAPGPPLQP